MSIDVAIVIATILGVLFPAYLIDAIRSNDEKAEKSKVKACIVFGAIVLITLMIINSQYTNSNMTKECDYMKKNVSRIIGLVMVAIAIAFIVFALNHPEMSFPWSNTITWGLYGLYAIVTAVLLIAPTKKK